MTRNTGSFVVLAVLTLLIAGCGDDSPLAPAAPLATATLPQADLAPPATPTGVTAQVQSRRVKLGWDRNVTDPDCVGYVLSRTGGGGTVRLIADPQDVTTFVDTHPYAGVAVYAVHAVDAAGNLSAAATFAVDFPAGHFEREISE